MEITEGRDQRIEHVIRDVVIQLKFTGDPDRHPHLLQVLATVRTAGEVTVDRLSGPARQRPLEVRGHELYPLLTNDFRSPPPDLHCTSPMSASSAARRRLRALCNNTRWFTSLSSRRSQTSSDVHPSMSRSTRTRRWFSGNTFTVLATRASVASDISRDSGWSLHRSGGWAHMPRPAGPVNRSGGTDTSSWSNSPANDERGTVRRSRSSRLRA